MLLVGSIPPAAAQSPVQIYGRVITSLNHTKTGNGASKLDLEAVSYTHLTLPTNREV